MSNKEYYKYQLSKIEANNLGDSTKIQISKGITKTNLMSLNDESATELVEWLKSNYNIDDYSNRELFGSDWSLDDIKTQAFEAFDLELTDSQAREIANNIEHNHDANIGINWEVITESIRIYLERKENHV